ncbi:beta-galactosidase-like [Telopea speciosissima]|uniref:beta-galactosidase-like n=1 Tax=Telopea speciosissima TaxID=54955 RepID=UPI001CC43E15|nr:beta-galactosidase-like [Telopea speciosissima]
MMESWREMQLVLGLISLLCFWTSLLAHAAATQVTYDNGQLLINGEPRILISGSIHYPRSTAEMWPDLIQKAKEGGVDVIETYIFWNVHEPLRHQYNFEGDVDFIKFFKTVQEAGLYGILRIGPYVCAEWNYGGFPVWLHNLPGIELRTDNQVYKDEMQTFTTKIVDMVKKANLFAPQGGPIILAQIENEYGDIMKPYGEAGVKYMQWCAKMAESQNIGIPWIMCQQDNAPQPMINTENGFYGRWDWKPNNSKSPKMWTENWTASFKMWGLPARHRAAEDVAYAVARFFQSGGVLQNYYMYHGGTNFGRTAGGPYIATTYDYDAPLDEYGILNQPKWGHLKQLHEVIKSAEKILTKQSFINKDIQNNVMLTTFTDNSTGKSFCFLSNIDSKQDVNVDLGNNGKYFLPAWSVSLLADCNKEIYNTAKVITQTYLKTYKPSNVDTQFNWLWKAEPLKDALTGKGSFTANKLLEQKATTVDASDYLWYMTSVNIDDSFGKNAILHVNTTGHVLHAYVNKKRMGSDWSSDGKGFVFEKAVTLNKGTNHLSLLSATVGLKNYGSFFDMVPNGIVGGPVQLIGNDNVTKDLSSNEWSYKIGLNGENKQFYNDKLSHNKKWTLEGLPLNRPMTWYKTSFKAPLGNDPVVVDLLGMGKGHAWVNGHGIGRFWLTMIAKAPQGFECSEICDYRGQFHDTNCMPDCGLPSQRWYHIPRSFLNEGDNTLILFEEMGGNPTQINFQTVIVGKVCGNAYEGSIMELSCKGGQISAIEFASFGDPQGTCGSFKKGSSDVPNTLSVLQKACLKKESCSINVSGATFGFSNSNSNTPKKLAVQAVC